MATSALQAFKRTVTVAWPARAQGDAKALLLKVARNGHGQIMAEAKQRSGAFPQWDAYANRPGNKNLESVVLPGPIVYTYRHTTEILQFIITELIKASPFKSGDYRKSHLVFVDGVQVQGIPTELKPGQDVMVINPLAYSRKLEIGKTQSGRDFLISVPNRIYERVAKMAKAKYGNVARISMTYATVPGAYTLQKDNPARAWLKNRKRWYYNAKQRPDRVAGAAVRSPAIVITSLA